MNIGLFGGSFNPIHNGHITLAETFLKEASLQEVWLMVSPQNPFKTHQELLDDEKRLEIAQKALINHSKIIASDYELSLPKPSYTWNTLQHLAISYPENTFSLLIGGDNWRAFNHWSHAEDIISQYQIYIYPRKDDHFARKEVLPKNVHLLQGSPLDISSTLIRNNVKQGKSIHHLVPQNIIQDIEEYYR